MADDLLLFKQTDFPDEEENQSRIHIRVQQRNGRKCVTTVQGLAEDLDLKKILKYVKRMFNTNATVVSHEDGDVIQLQGDKRNSIARFLTEFKIAQESQITVHGFWGYWTFRAKIRCISFTLAVSQDIILRAVYSDDHNIACIDAKNIWLSLFCVVEWCIYLVS